MKNKKGFTIVELVIVIAVIAILAAVLIPTFSSVVAKAQASGRLQAARAALTSVLAEESVDGSVPTAMTIYYNDNGTWYTFAFTNSQLQKESAPSNTAPSADSNVTYKNIKCTDINKDITVVVSSGDTSANVYTQSGTSSIFTIASTNEQQG